MNLKKIIVGLLAAGLLVSQTSNVFAQNVRERFEIASMNVKNLAERPDNQTQLMLYALYKQGSAGNVQGARPSGQDFVATAKWDAWNKLKGMNPAVAQQRYADLVESLM